MEIVSARRFEQRKATQNRVVAEVDSFDLNHRHRRLIACIISGPFAKGSFWLHVFEADFAFDGDFSISGQWESRERAFNYAERMPKNPSRIVVFIHSVRHVGRRDDKIKRMMSKRYGNGKRFSLLVIFFLMNPPVLSRRHMQTDSIRPMHHDPVGTHIYPALFWVSADDQIIRADIAATVQFMPARYGEIEQIYLLPPFNILKE